MLSTQILLTRDPRNRYGQAHGFARRRTTSRRLRVERLEGVGGARARALACCSPSVAPALDTLNC